MSERTSFQTFVFVDLEGTDLDRPRLTELCLTAVHRYSLENHPPPPSPLPPLLAPSLPRVLDKLCLCAYPHKPVCPRAAELSGLSNENLTENGKPGFDGAAATLIRAFLERQAPPVCLVAHCGLRYDFPLLRAELGRLQADLPSGLFCADSYLALRDILAPRAGSFSLPELYRSFYGSYPPVSHTAEADTLALVSVFLAKAPELLSWADLNARPWLEVQPKYQLPIRTPTPQKAPKRAVESRTGGGREGVTVGAGPPVVRCEVHPHPHAQTPCSRPGPTDALDHRND
ncbi:three prime repair exonuclease 2 [Amia ocellicauda]|uniref:three prime repair exonuclease 2 n=1 Tax=Amia ocellicauda TaxID=2972642 RepID=UPI0034648284